MEGEGEGQKEISLEEASKVIKDKGGQVFLSDHVLEEHIQNSDIFQKEKKNAGNAMGAAYKRSGEKIAQLLGVEVEEGDKFEDVLEKAKTKLDEFKKDDLSPEIEAIKTQNKETADKLKDALEQLANYQNLEFESNKIKMFKEALGDKALDVPEGVDSKFIKAYFDQFQQDILGKAEFVKEDGNTYMKIDGNTYQGASIQSKLKELISDSGYKFKEKTADIPPGTLPDIPDDKIKGLELAKREEMAKKEATDKGLSMFSKEYFVTLNKYGLEIPDVAKQKWPELAK